MPHSTPEPEISPADVFAYAEQVWQAHEYEANLILMELTDGLRRTGFPHGDTLLEIAAGYGACTTKILRAGLYLADRGVISLSFDDEVDGDCLCAACRCKRGWATLAFDHDRDRRELQALREQEARRPRPASPTAMPGGHLYLMRCGDRYKIGISTDVDRRLRQLRSQQPPFPIELIHTVASRRHSEAERALHERFSEARVHGEWFALPEGSVERVIWSMNEWADGE